MLSRLQGPAVSHTLYGIKLHVHFAQALLVIPINESKGIVWYATREESSRPVIWKRVQVEVTWQRFRPNLLGHFEIEDSAIDSLGKYLPFSRNLNCFLIWSLARLAMRHVRATKNSDSAQDECILFCEELGQLLLETEPSLDDSSRPLDELLNDVSLTTKQLSPKQETDREGDDLFASSLPTTASGPQPFTKGQKRYDKIRALLIRWEEHTLSFGEVIRAREALESYNYEVEEFRIPKSDLKSKIRAYAADIKEKPNLNTLLIIWYYGNGGSWPDGENRLTLASHKEGGTCVRWSDVAKAILEVRTDVFTILDCCHAGASALSEDLLRPFIASNKD
ncbi:homeobox domain containing protein [Colletotrichum asianum]